MKEAQIRITVEGKDLEQVSNFTYLGANIGNDGRSEKEIRIGIAKATNALARLEKTWKARNIHIRNKLRPRVGRSPKEMRKDKQLLRWSIGDD